MNRYWVILSALASAVLVYLSFPNFLSPFGFGFLAWIALIPLFFSLDGQPLLERLKIGALFGLMSFFLMVHWILPYNFLGYFSFVLILSVAPVFFAILFVQPFRYRWLNLLYGPILWVSCEFLRMILMGGFCWNLGYSQSFYPTIIQMASLTGSFGISFFIVLFNYGIYRLIKDDTGKYIYIGMMIAGMIILIGYGQQVISLKSSQQKDSSVSPFWEVAAIQPNIKPVEKWNPDLITQVVQKHIRLTQELLRSYHPDIVVWPETAIPQDFIRDPRMRESVTAISQEVKTHLLLGAALIENDEDYNSALLLNGRGAVLDIYRKKYLVPFSEYLPLKNHLSFLRDVFNFNIYDFQPGQGLGIFRVTKRWAGQEDVAQSFGVALCSEGAYPVLFRQLAAARVGFVVLMLNDAWFSSKAALVMHTQNEIMRAVENRLPIMRVANSGWSCSIDELGRIKGTGRQYPGWMTAGYYLSHIFPNQEKTFYSQHGDVFALVCLIFVIIVWVLRSFGYYKKRKRQEMI